MKDHIVKISLSIKNENGEEKTIWIEDETIRKVLIENPQVIKELEVNNSKNFEKFLAKEVLTEEEYDEYRKGR